VVYAGRAPRHCRTWVDERRPLGSSGLARSAPGGRPDPYMSAIQYCHGGDPHPTYRVLSIAASGGLKGTDRCAGLPYGGTCRRSSWNVAHVRREANGKELIDRDFPAISMVFSKDPELFGNDAITRVNVTPPGALNLFRRSKKSRDELPHVEVSDSRLDGSKRSLSSACLLCPDIRRAPVLGRKTSREASPPSRPALSSGDHKLCAEATRLYL
jgi:hypothetical protein